MPKPTVPLDVAAVRGRLSGSRFADVRYVAETRSTNIDAQALLGDASARGATVVAEYQSAGAGRKGRRWFAPAGSALLFTSILPQPIATSALWAVPFWIALAVAAAVADSCNVNLDLVWPNDLHARSGGKVAGVLSVARIMRDEAWIGAGVGINVHRPAADSDLDALARKPVFLDELAKVDRATLLTAVLQKFDTTLEDLAWPTSVAERWERRAQLAGTVYRYENDADGVEREGIAQHLGPHGSLVVRDRDGETTVNMADVRVVGRSSN